MKKLVEEILKLYYTKMREPKLEELEGLKDPELQEKACCFVTLYLNGEVRWSAGNIKEIQANLAQELYANTIQALTWDKRFPPLTLEESQNLKFRCDKIMNRKMISEAEMKQLDPTKVGVIVIKRDYEKVAVILPNMSPSLLGGDDFIPVLAKKLDEKVFHEKDYIIYEIQTQIESNY
jgi:AMMECR1 domain-containing protein